MAFFGLFGKKKDKKDSKQMPKPPVPPKPVTLPPTFGSKPTGDVSGTPSLLTPKEVGAVRSPQHVDDLGPGIEIKPEPIKREMIKDEIKAPKMGLELPELEFPQLEIPALEEEDTVVEKELPDLEEEPVEDVSEELPEIEGELAEPKPPAEPEVVTIEEPIELNQTKPGKGPVFIRSDKFKEIKDAIMGTRESLGKAEEKLNNVMEIKNSEDSEYEGWHVAAEAIQRKLLYIDNILFEQK
ncbi:hypothetical protein ACFL6I_20800 [candidate division KSB1 bacterium]